MTETINAPARPKLVNYQAEGGIATIELNDPPAHSYTYEMMLDFDEAILRARLDPGVYVGVIRGAGDRFFCGGANIRMLQRSDPTFKYYFCLHANETLNRLPKTRKLFIAAINGHCVGGGLEVALACDILIGWQGPNKISIGFPESNLGLLPGTAGTQRLARTINHRQAIELMALGQTFDLARAKELGILNRVFEAETVEAFMAQVLEYGRNFCPPKRAARAVGAIKRAVWGGQGLPEEVAQYLERELMGDLFQSLDGGEGLKASVEKRPPVFQGR
ncbi:MAG: enoyl-CoA hydratase/isomerase family protein [Candidatus Kerfeldbacteria bacterium]|nr:enoyl-CoA hydratase/isomerase family protein [Candidatus Kerfeldbacteria bacterium]